jgi:hypothetical protein
VGAVCAAGGERWYGEAWSDWEGRGFGAGDIACVIWYWLRLC